MRVYFGDDDETVSGRLLGVHDGSLVVGEDAESAVAIEVSQLQFGVPQPVYEESFVERLRSDFRIWNVEIDLAFDFEEGAVDKRKVRFGGQVARRRDPFRLSMAVDYALDLQTVRDQPEQTTKDELTGGAMGEYDLAPHWFALGLMGGEFDHPRKLEGRMYPTVGVGYRLFDSERAQLSPMLGVGYVWEDFQGLDPNDFAALFLGLEGRYEFGRGILLRGRLGYWPQINKPTRDWLLRSELSLTVPIWDPLALKASIININDNNPTPDVGTNKFETVLGLTLRF